jgi:hypothetical protein
MGVSQVSNRSLPNTSQKHYRLSQLVWVIHIITVINKKPIIIIIITIISSSSN